MDDFKLAEFQRAAKRLQMEDEKALLEGSLADFVAAAWHTIEGSTSPYESTWATEGLCKHLQAVTEGHIRRLLINFPPRSGKSNITSILWPAWVWARSESSFVSGPTVRFLTSSYSDRLALEFATKQRTVITSPWYQERWGERFELRRDQASKSDFANTAGGVRQSTSVGGSLIGMGGNINIADDLHNTDGAESEAHRETVQRHWAEFSTTRLNDQKRTALVAVMQRMHTEDVSGLIIASAEYENWTHFEVPMEYDPDRHCVTGWAEENKVVSWRDPRKVKGEIMWPGQYSPARLKVIKTELGPYLYSGRYQQLPTPEGGGILKKEWWRVYQGWPARAPIFDFILASLDTAYTEKEENDPSAMTVWGVYSDEHGRRRVMLVDAWRKWLQMHGTEPRQEPGETKKEYQKRCEATWGLVEWVAATCRRFKADRLIIEAKASGLSVAQEIRRLHSREAWGVETIDPKSQDKVARAHSVVPFFVDGFIVAPDTDWAQMVIDECASFPKGKHDDLVDSTTMGLRYLRLIGLAEMETELHAMAEDELKYRPMKKARLPYVA